MPRPVSDRRLILIGVFGILALLMAGALIRGGDPVPEGIVAALFALLGAALAYAYGRREDD